jgi:hypothetical protein
MAAIDSHAGASGSFLRLLCVLRWVAVAGQALTIFIVTGPMQVALPQQPLWAGVAVLAVFNVYASWRSAQSRDARAPEQFLHLLADIVVLSWQVGWSGGLENPFSSLFLLPDRAVHPGAPAGVDLDDRRGLAAGLRRVGAGGPAAAPRACRHGRHLQPAQAGHAGELPHLGRGAAGVLRAPRRPVAHA